MRKEDNDTQGSGVNINTYEANAMSEKAPMVSSMVSALDWMRKHGSEQGKALVSQMAKNLLDSTPLTAEGRAKGAAEIVPYLRGGLLDLQNAVTTMLPDSQQQATVLGMAGVPTPGEVDREQDAGRSILGYALPPNTPDQGMGREQDRGRDM